MLGTLIRMIDTNDAHTVASQRAAMFRDRGLLSDRDLHNFKEASEPWLGQLIATGALIGVFRDRNRALKKQGLRYK